jgi:hypothetical protein
MPQDYGERDRAYKQHRLWCDTGLWLRIVDALADPICEVSLYGELCCADRSRLLQTELLHRRLAHLVFLYLTRYGHR